jgi:hypothetical protein
VNVRAYLGNGTLLGDTERSCELVAPNRCAACLTVGGVLLTEADGTVVCSSCYARRNGGE